MEEDQIQQGVSEMAERSGSTKVQGVRGAAVVIPPEGGSVTALSGTRFWVTEMSQWLVLRKGAQPLRSLAQCSGCQRGRQWLVLRKEAQPLRSLAQCSGCQRGWQWLVLRKEAQPRRSLAQGQGCERSESRVRLCREVGCGRVQRGWLKGSKGLKGQSQASGNVGHNVPGVRGVSSGRTSGKWFGYSALWYYVPGDRRVIGS